MRILEILTMLALLLTTIFLFSRPGSRPGWQRAAFVAPVGLVLLHLLFEGSRWQMVPFYFLAVIFALLAIRQFRQRVSGNGAIRDRKTLRLSGALSALLLLLIASPLPYLFPVFEMPDPGGPYQIGTKMFRFVDETRPETFSPRQDDFREVVVQVWYPANPAAGSRPEPYREPEQAAVLSRQTAHFLSLFGALPPFVENHFPLVKTHAYKNAPVSVAENAWPVLLYSHGILFGHEQQAENIS